MSVASTSTRRVAAPRNGLWLVIPVLLGLIGLGVWLFGEHFTGRGIRLVVAVLAFAVMAAGVVFMTRTSPEVFEAPAPPASR